MKTPIIITPLTPDLQPAMLAASAADHGHCAPLATHVFLQGRQVVGAAALCAPTAMFWAHSQLHARESIDLARRCTAAALAEHKNFLCACSLDSPFWELMPRFGYRRLGNADFFRYDPQ